MSLPRLRRRVPAPVFTQWRTALPDLGLPARLDGASPPSGPRAERGVTVPPMVAAALALQGDPTVTVLFRAEDAGATVMGSVALEDGVVSAVVRRDPAAAVPDGGPGGSADGAESWVEVALVPADRVTGEVLRWLPARPAPGTAGEVSVLHRQDAAPCASWCWPAPEGVAPRGPDVLAVIRESLAACVAGCPNPDPAPDHADDGLDDLLDELLLGPAFQEVR